ncbi:hypothetical protein McanMca71_004407 [Microsporum canis]|uniref:Uncharacterized protein n=1 Tax=Arthroderma otae (strain ATCC MYA-4605 / CBS 113480) TaxID=554155 RepID=C5FPP2_ARTOC|nr:conserved hypothetical protein [Microsporum canis CBS 113480]EEQ31647.1 conserved hypothetical protein [Microsporum canis CBS 113480]
MSLDPRNLSIASARPTPSELIPYRPHPPRAIDALHYVFDKRKTSFPRELTMALPEDVHHAANIVRHKADAALKGFLYLEKKHKERFYYLCPLKPSIRAIRHINSIDRLFSWKTRKDFTAVSAKIPTCVVSFHVEEAAYAEFTAAYNKFRQGYLEGPFRTWLNADTYLRNLVDDSGMPMYTRLQFLEWWNGYRDEMRIWEDKVDSLVLPSWKTIVAELAHTIEERLDLTQEWERWV